MNVWDHHGNKDGSATIINEMPLNTWIVKNINKDMPLYTFLKTRQILITAVKQEAGSSNLGMVPKLIQKID